MTAVNLLNIPIEDTCTRIAISYIYQTEADWHRYLLASSQLPWAKNALLTQLLSSFFRGSKQYLQDQCERDAKARGYESIQGPYFEALAQWNEEKHPLRPYQTERPTFDPPPYQLEYPDISAKGDRRYFKEMKVSAFNAALFRLLCEMEQRPHYVVMSAIANWHWRSFWDKGTYQVQVQAAQQRTLKPEL